MNQPLAGHQQVEAFGPDEDYLGDEEIEYITLDLGPVEPTLVPSSSTYRLIGLDTPTPFLQLSGTVFKGRHENLLGTELLFTESTENHERSRRTVRHVANTEKRVAFKQVELIAKPSTEDEEVDPEVAVGTASGKKVEKSCDVASQNEAMDIEPSLVNE